MRRIWQLPGGRLKHDVDPNRINGGTAPACRDRGGVSGKELPVTLQELYQNIGGNYDQAIRVLRVEKLIDKHIRKFTKNGVVEKLLEAGSRKDPTEMFECAHAMKGVSANMGLNDLSEMASEIAEEYRAGNPRKMSDAQVDQILSDIAARYEKTVAGIRAYEEG